MSMSNSESRKREAERTPPVETGEVEALAIEYLLASCPECELLLRSHNQYRWDSCRRTRDEATVLWLAAHDKALRESIAAEIEACIEVEGDAPWSKAFVHGMTVAANIVRSGDAR